MNQNLRPYQEERFGIRKVAVASVQFMNRVYFWMMFGLVVSGVVAFQVANTPSALQYLMSHVILFYCMILLLFVAVIAISAFQSRMSVATMTVVYIGYSILSGLTLAFIFAAYTTESITQAYFITAFAFGGLSLYGTVTKRDLGPLGAFCTIGLFGLIGFMLVVLLFPSLATNSVAMTINTLAILIFAGLTAYDTQKIKSIGNMALDDDTRKKLAIQGALTLYLDFINIFISILRLFGDRR